MSLYIQFKAQIQNIGTIHDIHIAVVASQGSSVMATLFVGKGCGCPSFQEARASSPHVSFQVAGAFASSPHVSVM